MASSHDSLLNNTTIGVSAGSIVLSSLTENERGILLIALVALERANSRELSAGTKIGSRVGRSGSNGIETVVITPGNG